MSALYQAPKAPEQSDRMPILIAFDGVAAALVVDVVDVLLLPPQAAIHSPHRASAPNTASRPSSRRFISLPNLVTSSATCSMGVGFQFSLCPPRPPARPTRTPRSRASRLSHAAMALRLRLPLL